MYYVTDSQAIVKTDYDGSFFLTLYNPSHGSIHNLTAFGNILYFIEDGKKLIFLDTATGNTQLVLTEDDLTSVFVFNADKLIWYNSQGQAWYYNITTKQTTAMRNQYETNALIAQYILSDTETVQSSNTRSIQGDSYNDVTFPLDEYPAVAEVGGFAPNTVLSRFRYEDGTLKTYAGSDECDRFAKYAFDRFWHLYDEGRTCPSWVINGLNTQDVKADDVETRIQWYSSDPKDGIYMSVEQFFRNLERGSFVRYVSRKDPTPENGTHSMVFDKFVAGEGIWVYEANMDWDYGVGYQLYPFNTITGNYLYIMYYVEHDISENNNNNICEDTYTHKVCCANCDGYLRQEHSFDFVYLENYSETEHRTNFDCCDGYVYEQHEYYGNMVYEDEFTHNTYCSFCDAYIEEEHSSWSYSPLDETYHSIYFDCCSQVIHESHFTHDYRCLGCGMEFIPTQNVDNEETQ